MIEEFLKTKSNSNFLCKTIMGLERETMRTDYTGNLSLRPHPTEIGSALTHPFIKTDFSESQVEYATMASYRMDSVMKSLSQLHNFTNSKLVDETLWPFSMPPRLPANDDDIPLAVYGTSDEAIKKTVYRRGLGYRYGRRMQTISGVHINISFSKYMMEWASKNRHNRALNQSIQADLYMDTIRNFSRYSFILIYLFGASPAMDKSFCGKIDKLQEMDSDTWYNPSATSIRLSELGYTSKIQNSLNMSLNSLDEYIQSLCYAINTVYPKYSQFSNGGDLISRNQLNDFYLQIENEYYSLIRPKQVPKNGERPIDSLNSRGIRYLEIRCVDTDPFHPMGVSDETVAFNQLFLLWCLLSNSPKMSPEEKSVWEKNQSKVVWEGLNPSTDYNVLGKTDSMQGWWELIYPDLKKIAMFWDKIESCTFRTSSLYRNSLEIQNEKIRNFQLTPSYKIINHLKTRKQSYLDYGLALSKEYSDQWKNTKLDSKILKKMEEQVRISHKEQKVLEDNKQEFIYEANITKPATVCGGV